MKATLATAVAVATSALLGTGVAARDAQRPSLAQPTPLILGRVRAMVISPHPDDATLAAGGLIQYVLNAGGVVRIVQMTAGDGFPRGVSTLRPGVAPTFGTFRWYASVREREAIRAMRVLGVPRSQVRLLGFPDEGLCRLASTYRAGVAFESPYTKRDAPPDPEQIVHGTMYRGDDVINEMAQLIEEFRPSLVVLPHAADQHPDHCATHLLIHQALSMAAGRGLPTPRVLHYIVHVPEPPRASGADVAPPAANPLMHGWTWSTLPLTPTMRTVKRAALDRFRSQMLVMPDFFSTFMRPNELFVEGEPPLPIPCWCSGEDIAVAGRAVH